METDILSLIKESFELWYNQNVEEDSPVSVVINYSDTQTLTIKAYHKVCIALQIIGIKNGESFIKSLITLEENYNHGIISEEEVKRNMAKKLLIELFSYMR